MIFPPFTITAICFLIFCCTLAASITNNMDPKEQSDQGFSVYLYGKKYAGVQLNKCNSKMTILRTQKVLAG